MEKERGRKGGEDEGEANFGVCARPPFLLLLLPHSARRRRRRLRHLSDVRSAPHRSSLSHSLLPNPISPLPTSFFLPLYFPLLPSWLPSVYLAFDNRKKRSNERTNNVEGEARTNKSSFVVFLGRSKKKRETTKRVRSEVGEERGNEGHLVRSNNSISNLLSI